MPINTFYPTWIRRIQKLRPGQRITQMRTFGCHTGSIKAGRYA